MTALRDPSPSLPLAAIGALVLVTLVGVSLVRLEGVSAAQAEASPAVQVRLLRFDDRADGGIDVRDAASGQAIDEVAPGTNGFLRSALRGLVRERKRSGIGAEPPFRLAALADGRLLLEDPGTGRFIDLRSFGATNAGAFARLLPPAGGQPPPHP
ncbi:MAG: photosynthetic complex assembly protein PuhC [Burkholderiaceae bacterium]